MTFRRPIRQALREAAAGGVDRHSRTTRDWAPHDYGTWSRGRGFPAMSEVGLVGHPHESTVSPLGRLAVVVDLPTQDNLPGYLSNGRAVRLRSGELA